MIIIMGLLAATAIPLLAPALSNRQVREAARMVSSFLTGARNRAMLTGRPVGVVLDRLQGLPQACVALSYAEVPAPYAGDSTGSIVAIANSQITYFGSSSLADPTNASQTPSTDVGWLGTIRVGDLIRFNYQGPYFQCIPKANTPSNQQAFDQTTGYYNQDPANTNYRWYLSALPGSTASLPPNGNYGYQIIRAPVKLAAGGIQLPGPTVIDLTFSGFDVPDGFLNNAGNALISPYVWAYSFQPIWPQVGGSTSASDNPFSSGANDTSPIVITFAPSGAIDTVWCWYFPNLPNYPNVASGSNPVTLPYKPITPVHLLVGRREVLPTAITPPPTNPNPSLSQINPNASVFKTYLNWQDLGNFWVSINQQTGLVTTVENNAAAPLGNNGDFLNNGYGSLAELLEARQLALESQRMGGR